MTRRAMRLRRLTHRDAECATLTVLDADGTLCREETIQADAHVLCAGRQVTNGDRRNAPANAINRHACAGRCRGDQQRRRRSAGSAVASGAGRCLKWGPCQPDSRWRLSPPTSAMWRPPRNRLVDQGRGSVRLAGLRLLLPVPAMPDRPSARHSLMERCHAARTPPPPRHQRRQVQSRRASAPMSATQRAGVAWSSIPRELRQRRAGQSPVRNGPVLAPDRR